MEQDVTVRDADDTDLEGLMGVSYADRPAIHRDRLRDAATQHLRYLVAERSGIVVGFGVLVFSRPPTWPEGAPTKHVPLVIDLFVAEAQRGRGIGTSMMRHMEGLTMDAGLNRLYLSVSPVDNPGAYDLYLRLGYQPLQNKPYLDGWHFRDSDGGLHEGEAWLIDMVKTLR